MNTPMWYSWTFRKHSTLLITAYYLKNYINMELEGFPNDWFKSYLTNRTQQTKVNDSISEKIEITYGYCRTPVISCLY